MESSQWVEVVTHPITGERTMLSGETEEELERRIEAWKSSVSDAEQADRKVPEGVPSP